VLTLQRHGVLLLTDRDAVTAGILRPRCSDGITPVQVIVLRRDQRRTPLYVGSVVETEEGAPARPRRPARFASSKFVVPVPVTPDVARPSLVEQLERAGPSTLRLVVGPAGSGKTTILAQWVNRRHPGTTCWMQADRADASAVRAWQAIIHAVRSVAPGFADEALELIALDDDVEPDALEAVLTAAAALPDIVLVIDDAHLLGSEVHDQLRFVLDRGIGGLQLALGSRTDPPVGLDRLRAAGRLCELRDRDLRFDRQESDALLATLGVPQAPGLVESLAESTQGWAAGLHLAAVALTAGDAQQVVDRLVHSPRAVEQYLLDEILRAQPEELQRLLLDTCVVDELTPQLALALHQGADVGLRDVEQANLLTTRVAPDGEVVRHHPLVLDTLRAELHRRDPELERQLHARAADHFETRGDLTRAFRHRWLAGRPIEAADMIGAVVFDTYLANRLPELDPAAHAFADHDLRTAPGACIGYCVALVLAGHALEAERLAARITSLVGSDLDRSERLQLLVARVMIEASLCDFAAAVHHGNDLLAAVTTTEIDPRLDQWVSVGIAMTVRGLLWTGQVDLAASVAERLQPFGGGVIERIEHAGAVAQLRLEQGRPAAALEVATAALSAVADADLGETWEDAAPRAVRGGALLELGELDAARLELERVVATGARSRIAVGVLARIELARLWRAEGSSEAALTILDDARQLVRRPSPGNAVLQRVRAHEAVILIDLGELDRAAELIDDLSPGGARAALLARLQLANGRIDLAATELDHLVDDGLTLPQRLDLAALRLRIALAAGDDHDDLVDTVLDLGAEGGLVFQVAEASAEAFPTVCRAARRRPVTSFLDAVLRTPPHAPPAALSRPDWPSEALTERERTLLRYVATSMSYSEIAAELYISVNTVKTHVKSIIRKFHASSRAEAIERARTLGYL
jgi:LuxR family transcriptional regulator, maltose regulon positive regulatory protein